MKLFTYGTLMQGENKADYLERVRPAKVVGRLYFPPMASYPAAIIKPSNTLHYAQSGDEIHISDKLAVSKHNPSHPRIVGELHDLRKDNISETIAALDRYERFTGDPKDSLYLRVVTTVEVDGGHELAWMYVYNLTPIENGDWGAANAT